MAKVIPFPVQAKADDNLLGQGPFTFRRAEWGALEPVQVERRQSEVFENQRAEALGQGRPVNFAPVHLVLKGSLTQTVLALFRFRE
ncbi:MAG: hypothetical protein JRJ59_10035, partial [Deltaproteobacteria bacterium]|nr:hypothetical protein [Deltaproteobacteria bacterium]